ncbi:MAG: 2,3-diphosphoglycerate synthetase [Candidatus Hodarchaeota archaeon]
MKRVIALIDGEHYPPVNKAGLETLRKSYEVAASVFIGGTEKVGDLDTIAKDLGSKVYFKHGLEKGEIPHDLILQAINEQKADIVYDLSDEPVVTYHLRFDIACTVLRANTEYVGADFHFKPPVFYEILTKPSISILGTAKRVGKTGVAGYIARLLDKEPYFFPAIVTMGRGGPPEPELVKGREINFSPTYLIEQSKLGKHACSDHWEDAYTSRVTTIGCRRCGGGMAGQVFISSVPEGAKLSNELEEDFTIVEGSGATLPPIQTDQKIVIVGANQPIAFIEHYFGPYRIGISDLAIVTACEEPLASKDKVKRVEEAILHIQPEIEVALTVFRPKPLGEISNKKVFVVMTAPAEIVESKLVPYIEKEYQCEVVGYSPHLSNRPKLRKDLAAIESVDLIMPEIKAAGVDVAAMVAVEQQKEVVFMDNIPILKGGTVSDLDRTILSVAQKAKEKFKEK